MALLRRILWLLRPLKKAKAGYTEEVLYAGWVDTLPPKIRAPRK